MAPCWRSARFSAVRPAASPRAANLGAGLGLFLMLLSISGFSPKRRPGPAILALVPTVGCALVIACAGRANQPDIARQSRRAVLRADLLSALSLALAAASPSPITSSAIISLRRSRRGLAGAFRPAGLFDVAVRRRLRSRRPISRRAAGRGGAASGRPRARRSARQRHPVDHDGFPHRFPANVQCRCSTTSAVANQDLTVEQRMRATDGSLSPRAA